MTQTEVITIVLASDNFYAILIAALIKSIEQNHATEERLSFYLIDDGISETNRKKITNSISPNKSDITWCLSKHVIPQEIKLPIDKSAFPMTTYLRLFAPYVVPANCKKLLFLDVDMIVLEDISKLWHTDLKDNLFGAVQDLQKVVSCSWGGIPNYKELGIPASTKYFNAGLLLIDVIKWRNEDVTNKVIHALVVNQKFVNWVDQYALNVVLYNQWLELDPRWNWFASQQSPDPFIIHFLDVKPIFTSYKSVKEYQDYFFKYLELTAWKGFKPIGDYRRLSRKIYNKVRKQIFRY